MAAAEESGAAEEEILRRTETGYLLTTTLRLGSGESARLLVERRPGTLRGDDLEPDPDVVRRIVDLEVDGVRWSPMDSSGRHEVPGEASAATLMLAGMPAPGLARMVGPLGAALRAVHSLPSSGTGSAPSGLRRLRDWLETGSGPGEAPRLHAEFQRVEGLHDHLATLIAAVEEAPRITCLGAPGGNTLYPDPAGSHVAVLVTDEVCAGPGEWDLGWVLGEFLELSNDPHLSAEPVPLQGHPVVEAVLAAYGPRHDRRLIGSCAVLRWAVHLHDFAAYVEWAEDFGARAERLAQHAAAVDGVLGER